MSPEEDTPTDPDDTGDDTDEDPNKIRLPTQLEVAEAVESTPTVEESEKPDMTLPEYLAPSAQTIELDIDESIDDSNEPTERMAPLPGFTQRVSNAPTEREVPAASLSSEVIEPPPAQTEGTSFPWMIVAAAVVVAVVVAVLAFS